jgi:hypothetical protein
MSNYSSGLRVVMLKGLEDLKLDKDSIRELKTGGIGA